MSIESDIRITPAWLIKVVREFAGNCALFDTCTERSNPIGAEHFYTFDDDGLNQAWSKSETNWCNPPYSRNQIMLWARKCRDEAYRGCEIVLLAPADVSTGWYAFARKNADARCDITRRVGFLKPDGNGGFEPLPGAKFGSTVFYFGQRRRRFDTVFGAVGHVTHGLGPESPYAKEAV